MQKLRPAFQREPVADERLNLFPKPGYALNRGLALKPALLWDMLPAAVTASIRKGLADFSRKIKGYEKGNLMGLESKTSSPVQVIREQNGLCTGFDNLFLAGEGSGYAGGIVSSAADGIKIAMNLIRK